MLHWTGDRKPWKDNGLYKNYWEKYKFSNIISSSKQVSKKNLGSSPKEVPKISQKVETKTTPALPLIDRTQLNNSDKSDYFIYNDNRVFLIKIW